MMRLPLATLTLSLSLFAAGASAACTRDAAPAVPDGSAASLEEMKAAQQAVKAYQASSNAFLACLDAEGQAAGAEEAAEAKAARVASYNAAVDEQTDLAARFNAAVQAYKSRN